MICYDVDGLMSKAAPLESQYIDINTGELYVKLIDRTHWEIRWLTRSEALNQYDSEYVELIFNPERFSYLFN